MDRDEANDLRSQLASGLCSLAEMHMASDKDIEAAATECEPLLQEARQADMASPEPLQVFPFGYVSHPQPLVWENHSNQNPFSGSLHLLIRVAHLLGERVLGVGGGLENVCHQL